MHKMNISTWIFVGTFLWQKTEKYQCLSLILLFRVYTLLTVYVSYCRNSWCTCMHFNSLNKWWHTKLVATLFLKNGVCWS